MAPELRLSVGLDLAFFRQQMRKAVNIAQSEFTAQLQVKFNRQALNNEIRNLDRAIKRKKFNVELNLVSGLTGKQFDQIQARLDALAKRDAVEIPVSVRAAATGKDVQSTVAQLKRKFNANQQVVQGGGKLRFPVSIKSGITNADVTQFRRDIEGKLKGIKVKVKAEVGEVSRGAAFAAGPTGAAGLYEFMRTQGLSGGNMPGQTPTGAGRRAQFQNAVEQATSKELKRMLKTAEVAGRSKLKTTAAMQKKLLELDDIAMENILGNLKMQMQEPRKIKRSFLDQIARAVMYMAGVDPEVLRQQAAARRLPPAINFPATVPSRTIPIGPSTTGRALPSGRAAAGMISGAASPFGILPSISGRSQNQAIIEALIAGTGPRMLPPSGGPLADVKRTQAALQKKIEDALRRMYTVLEVDVKTTSAGLRDSLETFSYLVQALKDAEGRTKAARITDEVESFISKVELMLRTAASRLNVRQVAVREIGQAQLAPSRVAGLLPSAVGRSPNVYATGAIRGESRAAMFARREQEARVRSALRSAGLGQHFTQQPRLPGTTFMGDEFTAGGGRDRVRGFGQPPERGGAIVPYQAPRQNRFLEQLKQLPQAMRPLQQSNVPLTGAISELAGEFGNAIKQVLLFGTAYKALAFFINLPSQALEAARSLQSFNNQVDAITGSTANANQAINFINDTVEQFNIPLQSARDGFLKLYASMAPADISVDVIEGLFTGISQASATLGLSADQVDRVTYAFSQMASKGKIMSEEVTGQLGDVIPGALSLMADAAGLSMAEFKDAMEKGQLSGKAMQQVFENLEIVFSDRFGKGAVGAADTLQGSMNDLQTSVTRMYEAFEPLVDLFAANAFPALSQVVEDATSAIEAFALRVDGVNPATNLMSENAKAIYSAMIQVQSIIQSLTPIVSMLAKGLVAVAQASLQILSQPLVMFLTKWLIATKLLIGAYTTLAAKLILAIKNIKLFIAALKMMTVSAKAANIAMKGLKIAMGGIIAGGILIGLEALAEHLATVSSEADGVKKSAEEAAAALQKMSFGEMVAERRRLQREERFLVRASESGGRLAGLSVEDKERARALGITAGQKGQERIDRGLAAVELARTRQKISNVTKEMDAFGRATSSTIEQITPVTLEGGDGEGKGGKNKLKDYDRDLKNFYTNIARRESEAIKQRMDMTAREKEITLAVIDFNLKETLAKAQYQRDIAKVNELVAADRAQYLADKKADLDEELKLAQQEFGTIVMSPFAKRAEDEVEAQNKLKASIAALKSGREELSAVEEAELLIQNELKGVTKEYADNLTPVIEYIKQLTKETRNLTQERNALRDQLKAQGRLRLAGMFDPAAELRERIRQRLGEAATPERVEEIARLEESAAMMEDLKGAVQGVRDEFAGLFSTMITGSGSAQEALAQSFANIGKSFADMAGKMIAQWLFMKAIGLIGNLFGGGTSATDREGTSGVGPVAKAAGVVPREGFYGPAFANGGIAIGGFQAFANGGIVNGPTLGLVGEGRYNEAIVPLPDGKSIPVELGGDAKNIVSNITVNVNNGQARSEGNKGANDLGRKLEGAVKQVIIEELRPGGVLAGKR